MKYIITALVGLSLAAGTAIPAAAQQHRDHRGSDHRWNGDNNNNRWDPTDHYRSGKYRERRLSRNDHIYRGRDGRYYCRRNDGTTGLVIGAVAGGLLGNAIGGSTLSTLIGGAGGAALGRSVDRGNLRCR